MEATDASAENGSVSARTWPVLFDDDRFEGRIVDARWDIGPVEYGSKDTLVLDIVVPGRGGVVRAWYKYSTRRGANWWVLQEHLQKLVPVQQNGFSEKDLVGLKFAWERITVQQGRGDRARDVRILVPLRLLDRPEPVASAGTPEPEGDGGQG